MLLVRGSVALPPPLSSASARTPSYCLSEQPFGRAWHGARLRSRLEYGELSVEEQATAIASDLLERMPGTLGTPDEPPADPNEEIAAALRWKPPNAGNEAVANRQTYPPLQRRLPAWVRRKMSGKVVWLAGVETTVAQRLALMLAVADAKLILSAVDAEALRKLQDACVAAWQNENSYTGPFDAWQRSLKPRSHVAYVLPLDVQSPLPRGTVEFAERLYEQPVDVFLQVVGQPKPGEVNEALDSASVSRTVWRRMLRRGSGSAVLLTLASENNRKEFEDESGISDPFSISQDSVGRAAALVKRLRAEATAAADLTNPAKTLPVTLVTVVTAPLLSAGERGVAQLDDLVVAVAEAAAENANGDVLVQIGWRQSFKRLLREASSLLRVFGS